MERRWHGLAKVETCELRASLGFGFWEMQTKRMHCRRRHFEHFTSFSDLRLPQYQETVKCICRKRCDGNFSKLC